MLFDNNIILLWFMENNMLILYCLHNSIRLEVYTNWIASMRIGRN